MYASRAMLGCRMICEECLEAEEVETLKEKYHV